MTEPKASDLRDRFASVAARSRAAQPGEPARPAAAGEEPAEQPRQVTRRRRQRPVTKRFTVDLEQDTHHRLREVAVDLDADATEIVRILLSWLSDPQVVSRIRSELDAL
jgi:hypothetical protein